MLYIILGIGRLHCCSGYFSLNLLRVFGATGTMELTEGMKVEIRSDEKGYEGAWFEGFVKAILKSGGSCQIQYDKFQNKKGKPCVEIITLDNMRPSPPDIEMPLNLCEGFYIDAYDTDCWWRGFLVDRVSRGEERWLVSFPDSGTFQSYPRSAFRMAQEWKGGKWTLVPPVKNSEVSEAKRKVRVGNSEGGPLKSQAQPIIRAADNSSTHSSPASRLKKHRIARDSDGPQKSVPKHNNLNVYRELLRAFHSDSCRLTAKRLEILRAVRLELGITESDHVVAIEEIVLSASGSGSAA